MVRERVLSDPLEPSEGSVRRRPSPLLLWPALLLLGAVTISPFVILLIVSFGELRAAGGTWHFEWVGVSNYKHFGKDSEVLGTAFRTAEFALVAVLVELLIGIVLGELLHRGERQRPFALAIVFLPLALAPVVIGLMWRLLYQGEFGILSLVMKAFGLFRGTSITSNPATALAALVVVDVWQWTPLIALVYLVVRRSLERGPVEAARLDGASELELVRDVVLPTAAGVLAVCGLLRFLDALKEFDKVFVLTGGGPGSATELASLYIWRTTFRNWAFGYGAALGITFYVTCLLVSVLILRVTQKWLSLTHH